ncbi:PLP-dependent aminotransferase family protein [uncultured Desulfuromusa sp.]|uniref:aminotransferase-like domain-containing protein n=1 Tax=uncultured Desulfuromusa sp. TaxID=219183 RepID=UPI002AA8697C|nr:PLP-dependent aminotransferase family protein [uncultured Desulfuromusa sp.]
MHQNTFRYRKVEQHIMDLVASQTLKAGDKLPSLRQLSRQLSVSISTISQAYLELEKKGIIVARDRSGYYLNSGITRLPSPASRPRLEMKPTLGQRNDLIQTVLQALGNPNLLPLGVVSPAVELLPSKTLTRLLTSALRENPTLGMNYSSVNGDIELRRQLALHSLASGITVTPEEILITSGAIEGIAIALRALTRPGDNVLIQSPSYFCFLQLLENCGLRAIEIPSSTTGIDPDDIKKAMTRFDIKAAILAPNFNNPDGSFTDDTKKQQIVRLLAEQSIPLVEDDVYGDLYFGSKRPATFKSFDQQGQVILCSSFSKTVAPGYRVGWMFPGRYYEKALDIKTTTNICTAVPNQMAMTSFLREGYYERHLRRLRSAIQGQMETLLLSLQRHFPATTRAGFPEGGAAIWVELPGEIDAIELFYQARQAGIGIAPGPIFSTQDKYNNFIRLSSNGIWNTEMEEGMKVLGQLAGSTAESVR